ncbi:MAG: leucine-rich repeat protein [Ruminococcus sp.]|nr:leucine-rich repeat protein [Ruminococcus sp.]
MLKNYALKILSIMLCLLLLLSVTAVFPVTVSAATSGTTGKCKWSKNGTTLIISGNGRMGYYDYYNDPAPWGTNITTVLVEEGVTEIGRYSFSHCESLTNVLLPSTLTAINAGAFENCTSLKQIEIPYGVTEILSGAFRYSGLTSVDVPDSVTWLDYYAFYYCRDLQRAKLSSSMGFVDSFTFHGCSSLTYVDIPNSVTRIFSSGFSSCPSLEHIDLPDNLTELGASAFAADTKLNLPAIPASCTKIDGLAFHNTKWYNEQPDGMIYLGDLAYHYKGEPPESVTIRPGTKYLADRLFNTSFGGTQYHLKSVTLPEGLLAISYYAFGSSDSLTEITIPDSVTSIEAGAFIYCKALETVHFGSGLNSIKYDAFRGCHALSSCDFPASLRSIGSYVFGDCDSLNEVILPEGVTEIGDYAFIHCTGMTKAILPNSLATMGSYAFKDCASLKELRIGNGLKKISNEAFSECSSLTEVLIPEGVTSISGDAFTKCPSLIAVAILESVTSIASHAFDRGTNLVIYGYKDSVAHQFANEAGIPFGAIDVTGDCVWRLNGTELTIRGEGAMADYDDDHPAPWGTNITTVVIEDGVTHIGAQAFDGCDKLSKITVPETLKSVGANAVSGTAWFGRQSDGVVYIGKVAYAGKGETLQQARIKDGTVYISAHAFDGCTSLSNVSIPDSVTSIGSSAFANCTSLDKIELSYAVTAFGDNVFDGCDLTIYGYDGSKAKTYAKNNSIPFVVIGGNTGDVKWRLDGTTLTLFGKGSPRVYTTLSGSDRPWGTDVTKLVVEDGVNKLTNLLLKGCNDLKQVVVYSSDTSVDALSAPLPSDASFTIYGFSDSKIKQYADKKNIPFVAIGEKGDVNLDGIVNINDVTTVQKYVARMLTLSEKQLSAADVTGDGNVDISDATAVQRYLAGIITEF